MIINSKCNFTVLLLDGCIQNRECPTFVPATIAPAVNPNVERNPNPNPNPNPYPTPN